MLFDFMFSTNLSNFTIGVAKTRRTFSPEKKVLLKTDILCPCKKRAKETPLFTQHGGNLANAEVA